MNASSNESASPLMGTYKRLPLTLVKGKGSLVYDDHDKRYIDFLGGIAVLSLGHCPDEVSAALHRQIDTLWHVSNIYHIQPQIACAEFLVANSCFDQVFFCNSGTEANEAALKLARLTASITSGGRKKTFIAMNRSFHGRSMGSLSVTGQASYREPFEPLIDEVRFVEFGDIKGLESRIDDTVAAIILEPLQAEGGLVTTSASYLAAVRELCDHHNIVLIFDEVQTGIGRLGTLFAHEKYGIEPDIMTLAKGLGGGFPIGAMLAREDVGKNFAPGHHASTFGGNPLATTAALAVLKTVTAPGFLKQVRDKALWLTQRLEQLVTAHAHILRRKGDGLLQGLEFDKPLAPDLIRACMGKGLLCGQAGAQVLRLAPALNIPQPLLEEGFGILEKTIGELTP